MSATDMRPVTEGRKQGVAMAVDPRTKVQQWHLSQCCQKKLRVEIEMTNGDRLPDVCIESFDIYTIAARSLTGNNVYLIQKHAIRSIIMKASDLPAPKARDGR